MSVFPPGSTLVVLASEAKLRSGSFVMMFITPPMALDPYRADPPPRITSTRSIMLTGSCSSPYTPARELKTGRLSIRIWEYWPSSPLIRSWVVPQFPQLFSTRRPGWKFIPSASVADEVPSKSLVDETLTMMGASFLLVSFRVADTTTSSSATASSSRSKLTSSNLSACVVTFFSSVLYPSMEASNTKSPAGRFLSI